MATKQVSKAVDRKKVLEEIRKLGSGIDRKSLFVRPKDGKPLRCWVLPDMRPRGKHGEEVPFLSMAHHWVTRKRQDGSEFDGTIFCFRHFRQEEPNSWKFLLGKDRVSKNDDCVPCLVLDGVDAQELPKDRFQRPRLLPQRSYNFQVVLQRSEMNEDDPQKIKILPANTTGMKSFMTQVYDEEEFSARDFAEFQKNGVWSSWKAMDRGWMASLDKTKKLWMEGWREHLLELELELASPVLLSFEEQIEILLDNLPEHAKLIKAIGNGERPQREPRENPKPSRSSQKTEAKSRILEAE